MAPRPNSTGFPSLPVSNSQWSTAAMAAPVSGLECPQSKIRRTQSHGRDPCEACSRRITSAKTILLHDRTGNLEARTTGRWLLLRWGCSDGYGHATLNRRFEIGIGASTGSAFGDTVSVSQARTAPEIDFECSQLFRASSSRLTGPRIPPKTRSLAPPDAIRTHGRPPAQEHRLRLA